MLQSLLSVIFFLLIFVAVLVGGTFFWRHWYRSPTEEDEIHYIRTADGWRLALHRYIPRTPTKELPVILCHGLSANRYCFDLQGAPSLARYLRDQGLEVWVPELRGSGMSDKPGLWVSDVPYTWSFDDHLTKDLPAIIEAVLQRTGAPKVHWVGHSMGGMLIRAEMSRNPGVALASAVTIGSPVDFSKMQTTRNSIVLRFKGLLMACPVFPVSLAAGFRVPVPHGTTKTLIGDLYPPNVCPAVARKARAQVSEPVTASSIWLTFALFTETGVFGPTRDSTYLDPLVESPVPLLVLAGSRDEMAPVDAVTAENGPKHQKRVCKILGKEYGTEQDYGHLDLLIGDRAVGEVFPLVRDWIGNHNGLS